MLECCSDRWVIFSSSHGTCSLLWEKESDSILEAGKSGCAQPVTVSNRQEEAMAVHRSSFQGSDMPLITCHALVHGFIQLLSPYILFLVHSLAVGIKFLRLVLWISKIGFSPLWAYRPSVELPIPRRVTQELCGPLRDQGRTPGSLFSRLSVCLVFRLLSCVSDESGRVIGWVRDSDGKPWERKCSLLNDLLLGV